MGERRIIVSKTATKDVIWIRTRGILICCCAALPIAYVLYSARETVEALSWAPLADIFGRRTPQWFLLRWLMGAMFALPSIGAIALVIYGLSRSGKDSFFNATLSGAAACYVAFSATTLTLMGDAPGVNVGHPDNVSDAVMTVLAAIWLSALYWVVAVRRERTLRSWRKHHEGAIRAME